MNTFNPRCPCCKADSLVETTQAVDRAYEYEGDTINVSLPRVPVVRCNACDEVFFGSKADDVLTEEFRRLIKLLSPNRIKELRNELGISAKELGELTGIAPETISRWERGHVIQSRAMDKFLRVTLEVSDARAHLRELDTALPQPLRYVGAAAGWSTDGRCGNPAATVDGFGLAS
jgi:putative zinc finger/helix-turn-helix YgiT family protein